MGLVRFILAISVAIDHLGGVFGYRLGPGSIEVEVFFIISGFYMCLVLDTRYYEAGTWAFYSNRYLRLFPTYVIVVVLTALLSLATGYSNQWMMSATQIAGMLSSSGILAVAYVGLANLTMLFSDFSLLLSFDGYDLHWTTRFQESLVPVYGFLLVPQSWSLGTELLFYLCAPFLLRSRWTILAGIFVAIAALAWTIAAGLPDDPFRHRFFPVSLGLFLLGSASWRIWRPHLEKRWVHVLGVSIAFLLIVLFVGMSYLPISVEQTRPLVLFLAAAGVAPIFACTQRLRFDRWIGDLSYPIYVSHLLALGVVVQFDVPPESIGAIATAFTIALSIALAIVIEGPLEQLRARRSELALGRRAAPALPSK